MFAVKKWMGVAALAIAGVAVAGAAVAQESTMERVKRTKELRVGTVAGAIPYFNKDLVSQKWEGFGPDFGESLAKKLGVQVKFVETTWGNSVLDLQSNKIDLMFALAPTPQRQEVVNFSKPLLNNTFTAVCKKGHEPVKTWEQLNKPEAKIVVDIGSNQDQFATRALPKASISRLESSGAATMSVQTGRSDCQVLVVLLSQPLVAKRPDVGTVYVPTPVETANTNVGLRKEANKDFENAVNEWLDEARSKGEIQSVVLKNMEKLAGVKADAFPKEVKF
ncbi:polar amino acid transport system substrate-binding protein [Comamonas odontotermitis]|uniref:Polar amino acid transport system substrate-binding protein n=1 Tax=Comamonas odontotermitis TaxID=379895 RepID=A0ABR6RHU6_9BURK|nr:transporter substrate-binding domain-containing protein [Comamonas odontotermitis]MBB6578604.1 polar amino acid transport system substrate-binding protein [Comamonas odontotermitis]